MNRKKAPIILATVLMGASSLFAVPRCQQPGYQYPAQSLPPGSPAPYSSNPQYPGTAPGQYQGNGAPTQYQSNGQYQDNSQNQGQGSVQGQYQGQNYYQGATGQYPNSSNQGQNYQNTNSSQGQYQNQGNYQGQNQGSSKKGQYQNPNNYQGQTQGSYQGQAQGNAGQNQNQGYYQNQGAQGQYSNQGYNTSGSAQGGQYQDQYASPQMNAQSSYPTAVPGQTPSNNQGQYPQCNQGCPGSNYYQGSQDQYSNQDQFAPTSQYQAPQGVPQNPGLPQNPPQNPTAPQNPNNQGQVNWFTNYTDAVAQAQQNHQYILLFFTGSDWCGWCQKMQKEVFQDPQFASSVGNKFVFVDVDFPQKTTLPNNIVQQNNALKQKYGIQGYPTIIILDSNQNYVAQAQYRPGGGQAYAQYLNQLVQQ